MSLHLFQKKIKMDDKNYHLLDDTMPFEVSEAYKAARTNLLFLLTNVEKKQIVFTGWLEHDGKSTSCVNMAISFAQLGKKVLLVDSDLRQPVLHRVFHTTQKPGLSEALCGSFNQKCIRKTKYENLYVLPAGTIPPNPSELLASVAMDEILQLLSQEFDYIFLDTPPLSMVTDAAVLSTKVGGAVIIIRAYKTTRQSVLSSKQTIENVGGKVFGFLLNDADSKYLNSAKYYSYSRYGHQNSISKMVQGEVNPGE